MVQKKTEILNIKKTEKNPELWKQKYDMKSSEIPSH